MNDPVPAPPVVSLRGLTKKFDAKIAVADLDLDVGAGEFFAFLGPNGAGKSTTIKMATGMLRPTSGSAIILGMDIATDPLAVKARIGILPEEPQLYERLTAIEMLDFIGHLYGLPRSDIVARSRDLLDLLELADGDRRKMLVDASMGMRKKVSLACALIHGPRLLFLDEPLNGIDAVTARAIKQALNSAVARGVTIFFSSHILEQVERLCHRIGIIVGGRLRALGTLADIRRAAGVAEDAPLEDAFVVLAGGTAAPRGALDFLG